MCFIYDSQNRQKLFPLAALAARLCNGDTQTFLCDVGTELLNIMQINFRVQRVSSLYASRRKPHPSHPLLSAT